MSATPESSPLDVARQYLQAIERGDAAAVAALLDPAIVQHELPNRLLPAGMTRDHAGIMKAFERGKLAMAKQTYVIERAVVDGAVVALEAAWTGTLAVAIGSLAPGDAMRARFAMFLEVRSGKIVSQRNYDCFEAF